ncbi:FkbM family methyltransferase [Haloprofundus salilacus]|uniref:FkbM family methyltransferase n=1 Tax=Haloprofundus salilacus TaxID=2876190 RepID=UPI001CCB8699|nr:FkbM family methyltransferase [Haloprofundus salilacus]
MALIGTLGDLLWGTPAYEYGSRAYTSAVGLYLRTDPTYTLRTRGASAVFRPSTFVEWNSLQNRIWDEEAVLERVLKNIREDDVFYDIGATIGIYSCLVGNQLRTGTVVPFEPYPPNVERLRVNLAANDIVAEVETRPLAAESRETEFYVYDTESPGAQHGSLDTVYPSGEPLTSFPVETVAGDRLVRENEIPAPTVVKMDVQGSGVNVLKGLRESLSSERCRLVYAEAHHNRDVLQTLLESFGFTTETLAVSRTDKEPTIVAARTPTGD